MFIIVFYTHIYVLTHTRRSPDVALCGKLSYPPCRGFSPILIRIAWDVPLDNYESLNTFAGLMEQVPETWQSKELVSPATATENNIVPADQLIDESNAS